jgi:hypothetical protein
LDGPAFSGPLALINMEGATHFGRKKLSNNLIQLSTKLY